MAEKFFKIIPRKIDLSQKQSPKHFTRDRKLPFSKLIVFILSIVASGKGKGVDVKSTDFFRNAARSGLWPDAEAIHRSSLSKARKKVDWTLFRDLLEEAVEMAYECFPEGPDYVWQGMSVYGVDGSHFDLPATNEIRNEFDPMSGLQYKGKGHYPQCLVSTVYDVFRRLPVARSIVPVNSSERAEVKDLLPRLPAGSLLLFDRGYPSYELIRYLIRRWSGFFIFRCPSQNTFPAVQDFISSGKEEDDIWVSASTNFLNSLTPEERKKHRGEVIRLRVVRLESPDGTISALLTNLFDKVRFPKDQIIFLYFRRWEVETYYRDEKVVLEIEKFHGKAPNSIRQELFAAMIMSVISRALMAVARPKSENASAEPQFKHAIMTLAAEAAALVPDDPDTALQVFEGIIKDIARVKYYRPKHPRPPQKRVTKRRLGKWAISKTKKAAPA